MICRLCNAEKGKLCKAHLFPEFFYRFMYPENKIEGEPLRILLPSHDYLKRSRVGLYDETILCASCDQILGKLDEYGKKVLLDTTPRLIQKVDMTDVFILDDVDVTNLSLFLLSVLWRCSISTRQEAAHISLGTKIEEDIRALLYRESDLADDFSIVITRYKFANEDYKKIFFMPGLEPNDGTNYYVYFPNGYKVLIKVDRKPQSRELEPVTMKIGRPVYVLSYAFFEQTDEFKTTSAKLKTMGKV